MTSLWKRSATGKSPTLNFTPGNIDLIFKEASEAAYSYINKNHSHSAVSEKLKRIIGEIEKLRH